MAQDLAHLEINEANKAANEASPKQRIDVAPTPAGKSSVPITPAVRNSSKRKWATWILVSSAVIAGGIAVGVKYTRTGNEVVNSASALQFSSKGNLVCEYNQGVFQINNIPDRVKCAEKILVENWGREPIDVSRNSVNFQVYEDDDREYIVNFYTNKGVNGYCSGHYQTVSCLNPDFSNSPRVNQVRAFAFHEDGDQAKDSACELQEFSEKDIAVGLNFRQNSAWIPQHAKFNLENAGVELEFQMKCCDEIVVSFLNSDFSKFDIDEGILTSERDMFQLLLKRGGTIGRFGIFGDSVFTKLPSQSFLQKCTDQATVKIKFCNEKQAIHVSITQDDDILDQFEISLPFLYQVGPFAFSAPKPSTISNLKWKDCAEC
jgi:hypothetical protein